MAEIRDWQIERLMLGELSGPELEALAQDPALSARVQQLEASNREILAGHPPRVAASVIRERLAASRRTRAPWGRLTLATAASLAVIGVGVGLLREARVETPAETRIKGLQPHLGVFRQTPAGVESLADGALVREGDLVQLTYLAAGRRFGVILSIDGRGVVTVHHPRDGRQAARLEPSAPVRLPSAYRLDDAPGWERFFLVTAESPFEVAPVLDAAEQPGSQRRRRREAARPSAVPRAVLVHPQQG